jgi:hypothetical protein
MILRNFRNLEERTARKEWLFVGISSSTGGPVADAKNAGKILLCCREIPSAISGGF